MRLLQLLIAAAVIILSPGAEITPERELVTKLQIYLDQQGFNPGKIDGKWGGFTEHALKHYYEANDLGDCKFDGQNSSSLADEINLTGQAFTDYEVHDEDLKLIGELPADGEVEAKSKLDQLLYSSVGELVAEKFKVDFDYLGELNPDRDWEQAKAGTSFKVPNIAKPFKFQEVTSFKDQNEKETTKDDSSSKSKPTLRIEVSRKDRQLHLFQDEELQASYPVSVGSKNNPAPKGDWEVTSVSILPTFRWDKQMLEEGTRSNDAYILPPGPNNPVGIVWIAINSDGIGIHGTNHPDTIGHADSHGCIRLANWDAWELAPKITPGTPVIVK